MFSEEFTVYLYDLRSKRIEKKSGAFYIKLNEKLDIYQR